MIGTTETETRTNFEPWALARIGERDGADRFPAILALRCGQCGELGPRSRMGFLSGTGGGRFLRSPICPSCLRTTQAKRSMRIAVAERRAAEGGAASAEAT